MRFKTAAAAIALVAAIAAPMAAQAHRQWLLPSATVLSGSEAWVAVDAGISNMVFVADHAAMRLDNMTITAPDGANLPRANDQQGRFRSTFDAHLTAPGTYRIANASAGVYATWTLNGETGRYRGPAEGLAAAVPEGATDLVKADNATRLETYVTLGDTTTEIFAPTGVGIELSPVTHPNDLVEGEEATFKLLRNGQPLADAEVTVVRGGIRYRNNPEEMTIKTGADGAFSVIWPEAGMYWVSTSWRPANAPQGGGRNGPPVESASYTVVLEVLP